MSGAVLLLALAGCRHEPARVSTSATAPTATGSVVASETTRRPPLAHGVSTGTIVAIPAGAKQISDETGVASWYGTVYDRRRAADGSVYDQDAMTAASRTLPLGVVARVTNVASGEMAVVRITDRGPFVPGRILDLSAGAARAAGLYRAGVGVVRVEAFAPQGMVETPGKWCVQIGAFLDAEDAQQLRNDLLRRYGSAKVIVFSGPTGSWVRLTPAGFDREESTAIASSVRVPDPGVGAYVTRLN